MNSLEINEIHQGDCLELMTDIPDESIDLIIIDPPYGCNATMKGNYCDDEMYIKTKIPKWIKSMYDKLKNGSYCYIYVPSLYIENWVIECKKKFKLLNILAVENMKIGRQYKDRFRNNCQLILVLSKGKPKGFNKVDWIKTSESWLKDKRNQNPKKYSATYPSYIPNYYKATVESSVGHPDEKNIGLIKELIKISSNKKDIVLDMFIGSGTTAVACINTNRNFIGIELDEKYCEIARKRVEEAKIKGEQERS